MGTYAKIKALQIGRKKTFRLLVLVEVILLLIGIVGLFGRDAVYQYDVSDTGSSFEGIQLPGGTYRVQMYYTTDTNEINKMEVTADDIGKESVRINAAQLFKGWDHTDEEMWLLRDTNQLNIRAIYGGEGSLTVHGLTIQQTNAMNRIYLFCMICLFTAVNVVYLYVQYDKKYPITVENKTVTFLLGVTILFSSIPLMLDYLLLGGDTTYHLMRIEGIKDGILNGQFPIRISPEWQQGYGYASPIFYGETVLYVAALFRLIGFSVTTSYRLFMFVITVMTVLIAYYCFKKMFSKSYIGVLCSAIYALSVYRFYKTYACGAFGESLGVMFLPLLAYGFYRVFTQDIREESYKRSWLPLTLGFALVLQSHLLTGEIAGFFTIILCVIMWKKVFRLQTFLVLAKTVIYSILLSAWFLVPFLDYMLTGDFTIHHVSGRTIQARGGYLAHLLFTFFENGGNVFFEENGMKDSDPLGMGIVLIMALMMFGYLLCSRKLQKLTMQERTLGVVTAGFGILAMIMSLSIFPWDSIQSINGLTATLVSSIQFPNRLLMIANVCLTVVVGVVAKYVMETQPKERMLGFFAGMLFCLAIGNMYLVEHTMNEESAVRIYNQRGMGTGYISGAEYLPYGADATLFMPHNPVGTGDIILEGYEKKSLSAMAYMVNPGMTEEKVAFALLYYKGYHAYDVNSGEELNCYAGDNFEVTVDIPAGFDGMVEVRFESPWYWRVGEIVTLVSVISMLVFFTCKRRVREV